MKCKRCNREMKRQKLTEYGFRYVCPNCGLIIGRKEAEPEDDYKEAYEILTGKDE